MLNRSRAKLNIAQIGDLAARAPGPLLPRLISKTENRYLHREFAYAKGCLV